MIANQSSAFADWLADFYLLSTILLAIGLTVMSVFRQPSRRMAVARSIATGLAALAAVAVAHDLAAGLCHHRLDEQCFGGIARGVAPLDDRAGRHAVIRGVELDQFGGEPATGQSSPKSSEPCHCAAGPASARGSRAAAQAIDPRSRVCVRSRRQPVVAGAGGDSGRALRRTARPLTPRIEPLVARVSRDVDRVPLVCLSTRIGLPVAIGVIRPMIVLPESFAATEPDERLEAALAHEWAHIRNGDLRWLALFRLLNVLLFAQPLFWCLRRLVRADQEALADASASTQHVDGRIAYAATLVGWARSAHRQQPGALASAALALWERPSMLHRRVRLLLDPDCRVEPNASGRWKLGAACLGLLGTLLLSTVTLRPGLATAQEMKAPSNQGHSREVASLALEAPGDSLEYAGRVLGPDGKPFAGARLHLAYFRKDRKPQARVRATSDAQGRFRFVVAKADFESRDEPWKYAQVVASADGFGPGWASTSNEDAEGPKPNTLDLTIRLAADDIAITGRLVDQEGRPAHGVTIQPGGIFEPKTGDLTSWMTAVKGGDQDLYVAERAYLTQLRWSDEYVASLAVSTDADGRFSIKGVGRERIVELNYHGPTVQSRKFRVLTREATPFLVNNARRSSDWGITQLLRCSVHARGGAYEAGHRSCQGYQHRQAA